MSSTTGTKRVVLIHFNVVAPADDQRPAEEIADAILHAIAVGSDDVSVGDLEVAWSIAYDRD